MTFGLVQMTQELRCVVEHTCNKRDRQDMVNEIVQGLVDAWLTVDNLKERCKRGELRQLATEANVQPEFLRALATDHGWLQEPPTTANSTPTVLGMYNNAAIVNISVPASTTPHPKGSSEGGRAGKVPPTAFIDLSPELTATDAVVNGEFVRVTLMGVDPDGKMLEGTIGESTELHEFSLVDMARDLAQRSYDDCQPDLR